MATKVKPTRLQITGTPQSGDVPMYVNADCFCRGQGGGGSGTVVGPSSSCDGDLAIFCGTCGDCIVDSGEKLCDYAKCCDMPDMSCYQQVCNLVCDLTGADDTHYPSAKAVADAIQSAGGGDMLKSVYDPNNCNADAFDYCNFYNTPTIPDVSCLAQCCDIPTNNCQLTNGCGYTTCIGDIQYCDFNFVTESGASIILDLSTDTTPSSNFTVNAPVSIKDGQTYVLRVNNGATAYTMTLGSGITNPNGADLTLTANETDMFVFLAVGGNLELQRDLDGGATYTGGAGICIDSQNEISNTGVLEVNGCTGCVNLTIPTDNCQLSNSCGYTTCTGTLSSCADVISALGFTPYNCTNPAGYTTCTGTLTSADLACYAQCCDIPSVSGFVQESCIACVNGCCLTQGGDICIQGGGGIENLPGSPVCICYKWTGDMCAYCALGTYRCDTEYNVYQ